MSRFGITFRGKHSYNDFGLTVASKHIGTPSKIKVKERIPYSNKVYDFSNLYGGQEYEERKLTYVFNIRDQDKARFTAMKIEFQNWLMSTESQDKLIDDVIEGYYFLAEVEEGPDFNELRFGGTLTVVFTAYPFMMGELLEGNDIWDSFNFLTDYAQITEFNVNRLINTTLYNPGANMINPIVVSSAAMQLVKNGVYFNIPAGESESLDFALNLGENPIRIIGNGKITFLFRKEVI